MINPFESVSFGVSELAVEYTDHPVGEIRART